MENISEKSLRGLIWDLTAVDGNELDSDKLKRLKSICKSKPEYVQAVGDILIKRLSRSKHCQIRFQCFRVLDHLFRRSSAIRSTVVSKINIVVSSTFGLDEDEPLPPPQSAREALVALSKRTLAEWNNEFRDKYPKLDSTSHYLKEHRNCDIYAEAAARVAAHSKTTRLWTDRCKSIEKEMKEKQSYMDEVCVQLQNAIDILVPSTFMDEDLNMESDEEVSEDHSGRCNGVLNSNQSVATVDLAVPSFINSDNEVLVSAVREQMKVLCHKLLPMATKWTVIFEKSDPYTSEFRSQRDLAESIRDKLEKMEQICIRLNLPEEKRISNQGESDEDDDFEEVPEKEGYEESYGSSKSGSSIEPWKDRTELKKLEAAIGQRLIFEKETKKRRLTPLPKDKARTRLNKIVFNRSSLKRVREDMNIRLVESSKRNRL